MYKKKILLYNVFATTKIDVFNNTLVECSGQREYFNKGATTMYKFVDLTGKKFGKLTVIKRVGVDKGRNILWLCKCDCGNEIIVNRGGLKNGSIKSCGCLLRETAKNKIIQYNKNRRKYKNLPYDKTQYTLYNVWTKMMDRCYNKKSPRYKDWGGRGIKVCKGWHNFENFYYWAISLKYNITQPWYDRTLDRIDNNANYKPGNCRVVSMAIQNKNKRNNKKGKIYA